MANENNVLGLNLNVSQEFIANTLKDAVNLALANALDSKNECLTKIIDAALSVKVNANGVISNYTSENKYSFIDYYVKNALMEETKCVLKEIMEERKEEIHNQLKKQIRTTKFTNEFCKHFCDSMNDVMSNMYRTNVSVNFEKIENRY